MKKYLVFASFLFLVVMVDAQVIVADTAKANALLRESIALKQGKTMAIAKAKLDSALIIYSVIGQETLEHAQALFHLDAFLQADPDSALKVNAKSLKIFNNIQGRFSKDISRIYLGMGFHWRDKRNFKKALHFYNKAKESETSLDPTSKFIARCDENIASALEELGDFESASLSYLLAIDFYKKHVGEKIFEAGRAYHNLGMLNMKIDNPGQSLKYLRKCYDIWSNLEKNVDNNSAFVFGSISTCFMHSMQYDSALAYAEKSLALYRKSLPPISQGLATAYGRVSNAAFSLRDTATGFSMKRKSIDITRNLVGKSVYRMSTQYRTMSYNCLEIGNYEMALIYADSSVRAFEGYFKGFDTIPSNEVGNLRYAYLARATALNQSYKRKRMVADLDQSLLDFKMADSLGQLSRNKFINPIKQRFDYIDFSSEGSISSNYEKSLITQDANYLKAALFISESAHSRIIQMVIANSEALYYSNIPNNFLSKEDSLRTLINKMKVQKHTLENNDQTSRDSTQIIKIIAHLSDAIKQYDTLLYTMEVSYPEYFNIRHGKNILQYNQISSIIDYSSASFLEYFIGDSSIFLFLINPNDFQVKEIKKDFPLDDWVKQLQSGLSAYHSLLPDDPRRSNTFRDSCDQQYITAARNLYDKLVRPVAPFLKEEVIIVPDGVLGYVPFEVLLTGPAPQITKRYQLYPYLLNKHRIRYTYSATLLKEMTDKKHRHEPEKPFAAFAPYYDGDTTVLAGLDDLFVRKSITPGDLQPLKYSGAEVAAAQKLMGGDVFTDTAATENRFNQIAGNYRILHLSTHGRADDRVGDYSYLVFSPQKDTVENELLYCRDIYNLSLNADLVVLSACETGLGKLSRGEGIISLARAFAYAGAKSIVNSLWSVNDASTQDLMVSFYKELKNGHTKSEALAQAKRRFLQNPSGAELRRYEKLNLRWEEFRHPYFWGGFILIGDDAAVK